MGVKLGLLFEGENIMEDVGEEGAEENICTQERESDRKLQEMVYWGHCDSYILLNMLERSNQGGSDEQDM